MGKRTIFFIALIFISGLMVTTAGAIPVIVGFNDKSHPEIVQPYGKVTHSYKYIPAVAADLPEQAIENLKKNPKIAYIEPDYEVEALEETVPWGISRIGALSVHETGYNGTGINVAVIDTGIDYTHPDLAENYRGGWDFVNGDKYPMDDNGHGTHCAGIIAAVDNEEGVIGVAPQANLYALKVLNKQGSGTISNIISAIEWSIDNNIKIISMSLGSDYYSLTLKSACDEAEMAGILLVAAAGNDYDPSVSDTVDYPGGYGSVIAVAATDDQNNRASFSSTGQAVELAAPGVNIYSTYWLGGSTYKLLSGTSMACPHVAGTAALVWTAHPDLSNFEVRAKLANTATDLGASGRDTLYGFGLVNAEAAADVLVTDNTAPVISEVSASSGSNSATITWNTDEASNSIVRYSTDKNSFIEISDTTNIKSHKVEITGLSASTLYYYEVESSDTAGNTAIDNNTSVYYTFTTLPQDTEPPVITNVNATAGTNSATIIWNTNEASNSTVRYSTDTGIFEEKSNPTLVTSHTVELTGLVPNTTYYCEVLSSDAEGNTAVDNNNTQYYSFTTSEESSGTYIYIDSVQVTPSSRLAGKNTFVSATAVVTIFDSSYIPVEGATVSGYWSDATRDLDSAVTDSTGKVTVYSDEVKYKSGTLTFTFTVNGVSHSIPWDGIITSGTGTYSS